MATFPLQPLGASPFDDANPHYYVFSLTTPRPAAEVWADLHGTRPLRWCKGLHSVRWTSPEPFGVGTTRTVTLANRVTIDERYFRWEEDPERGYVNAFVVESATVPLFRRLGERYTVVPGAGSSTFTWEFVIEPNGPVPAQRLAARMVAHTVAGLRRDTLAHFAASGG